VLLKKLQLSRLSRNIVSNFIGQGILIIVTLFSVKYIFSRLGGETLGIIYFISIISSILLSSIDKGISSTIIREIAGEADRKDYLNRLVQSYSALCWFFFLLFSTGVFFLAPLLVTHWIDLKELDTETAIWMVRFLSIAGLLSLPKALYMSIMTGFQRLGLVNWVKTTGAVFQKLGIIVILLNGGTVKQVVIFIVISTIFEVIAAAIVTCRLLFPTALLPFHSRGALTETKKFGIQMALISVLGIVQKHIDKLALSKLLPIGLLGYYSFIFNNVAKGLLISQAIAQAAYPHLSEQFKIGDQKSFVREYRKLQDLVCFMNVPVFIVLPFIAIPLLTYIFNREIALSLQLSVVILSVAFYMNGTLTIIYRIMLASGMPDIAVKQNLYSLIVVVPLSFLLIYYWSMTGAALAWVCYFLIAYLISIPTVFSRCLRLPWTDFYFHLLKILLLTLLTYGIPLALITTWRIEDLIISASVYSFCSIIYFCGAFFLIIPDLRIRIVQTTQALFSFV